MHQNLHYNLQQFKSLIKFRTDIVVALTSVFGYIIGSKGDINVLSLFSIFVGGFFITATANILNQIIERDYDKLMSRTAQRPLITKSISLKTAIVSGILMSSLGFMLLFFFLNSISAIISIVSLIMYAFIYTPMKRISRLSTIMGAIPGALPILIGYVGATGAIDKLALLLFAFQVFWQFPHFWSIAWIWNNDYNKAGYDLLPWKGGKTKFNAQITFISTFFLFPLIHLFYSYNFIGISVYIILLVLSVLFSTVAYMFFKNRDSLLIIHSFLL